MTDESVVDGANGYVAWSDEHGGFWVVTRYEDVLRVAQDWRTFSSAEGVNVPAPATPMTVCSRSWRSHLRA